MVVPWAPWADRRPRAVYKYWVELYISKAIVVRELSASSLTISTVFGSAVGTVCVPPAQGGIQILVAHHKFLDCRCVWFVRSPLALSTVSSQRFVSMMYHFVSCRITNDLWRFRICLGCVVCFPFVALCLESFGITCDVLIPSVVSSHRSSHGLS